MSPTVPLKAAKGLCSGLAGRDSPVGRTAVWYFGLFLGSGFCSLVYQIVWLRLAMAAYGVNAPIVSIVVSTFMMGIGIGSLCAGWAIRRYTPSGRAVARAYALAELTISVSAFAVPPLLAFGRAVLDNSMQGLYWGSWLYFILTGAWLGIVLLPWCIAMGVTIPLAITALAKQHPADSHRSFSYLYLANVIGATLGSITSAFLLIELLGLVGALHLAGLLNLCIAAAAFFLAARAFDAAPRPAVLQHRHVSARGTVFLPLLFTTGITSLGMEIVWLRQFTPYLGTVVYAFAGIIATYLAATSLGTWIYRTTARRGTGVSEEICWTALGLLALLPLLAADPGPAIAPVLRVVLGIAPFCVLLGFVTPSLMDRWSGGDGSRAGYAYAVNIVGSILGPLISAFVLLPHIGERGSLAILSAPLFGVGAYFTLASLRRSRRAGGLPSQQWFFVSALGVAALLWLGSQSYESTLRPMRVRRDFEATVVAAGEGLQKQLLVNGFGMTSLTPATKLMAHLPMSLRGRRPEQVLVIAFGMGTTFRSAVSWGVPVMAVDLVPSVPALFGYFHADAERVLRAPDAEIVIDDGRRLLARAPALYDVIIIDPPPPPHAAGSSLLYSVELYTLAKRRLRAGGILQQWIPIDANSAFRSSATRALTESFRHVVIFGSIDGTGHHLLASDHPLVIPNAEALARRMPPAAAKDLVEWGPRSTAEEQLRAVLNLRENPPTFVQGAPPVSTLRDDRPVNEYFLIRSELPRVWAWWARCCLRESEVGEYLVNKGRVLRVNRLGIDPSANH